MSWTKIEKFPESIELESLSQFLIAQKIPHRFVEEIGKPVLYISDNPECINILQGYFFNLNEDQRNALSNDNNTGQSSSLLFFNLNQLREYWVTVIIVILGFLGYLIGTFLPSELWLKPLIFFPPSIIIESRQVWRFLSPAFLHFSTIHFVFDGMLILYFGAYLEKFLGRKLYILVFLFTAVFSNIAQFYAMQEFAIFGGLSGVVFGYVGFLAVYKLFNRKSFPMLNSAVLILLIISLFLGFTGVFDWLYSANIAHAAHLGGFIAGIACGLASYRLIKTA